MYTWFKALEGGSACVACQFCRGPFHPATGAQYTPNAGSCLRCTVDFWRWVKQHTSRRWGGFYFYDHVNAPTLRPSYPNMTPVEKCIAEFASEWELDGYISDTDTQALLDAVQERLDTLPEDMPAYWAFAEECLADKLRADDEATAGAAEYAANLADVARLENSKAGRW